MRVTRREFLVGGLGAVGLGAAGLSVCDGRAWVEPDYPVVDFHVHLFGVDKDGTGCFISEAQKGHSNYRFLLKLLGLDDTRDDLDEQYVDALVEQLRGSPVDRAVLLAQDGRYDEHGNLLEEETGSYVPNEWLFKVVGRHKDLFVPCASINPQRRDALEELEKCADGGARIVKIHPPAQSVNPGESKYEKFYQRMTELSLILMVHTGTEHATEVDSFEYCDPALLELALQQGCTVIAAHSGFGSFLDNEDFFESMQSMIRRFPKLYCDTAVLGSIFRWRNMPRLLADEGVLARAVHGSDFPFPSNPLVSWNRLGLGDLASLLEERNLFARDLGLKRAMGFPDEYFARGAQLLGLA